MSDPAVEAAQRAWARVPEFTAETDPFAAMEAAAREALAPIRELHRPGYWVYTGEGDQLQDRCPECSRKAGVHACNSRAGCSRPVWCSCNKTIKVRWADCPTARLVYSSDELGGE